MKRFRHLIGIGLLGGTLASVTSWAQDLPKPPSSAPSDTANSVTVRQRVGRIIVPEKSPLNVLQPTTVRPVRPELDPLSPEVLARVRTFDQYRDEYLRQQEEIRKRNKGTTDQDRERIRAQLKELRERWREQSVAMREEMEARRQEIKERLPSHRELLENAREQGREAIRDQRQRRGVE
jgi:hypothetical protein